MTEEKFDEYELTEKCARVDQNESKLTLIRIDLTTNWLRTEALYAPPLPSAGLGIVTSRTNVIYSSADGGIKHFLQSF